jgi:hypothetical protein
MFDDFLGGFLGDLLGDLFGDVPDVVVAGSKLSVSR